MVQTTAFGPLLDDMLSREEKHLDQTGRKSRGHHGWQQRHRPGHGPALRRRRQIGKHVTAVQGDVSQLADLDRLYATVKQQHGRLDIVFANAGVDREFASLGDISEARFDNTFNINVKGLLFTVQKALPLLQDGGSIILTASTNSIKPLPESSVYSATKAAVRSFARSWTLDLQARQIRVNAISPGPTNTPMTSNEEFKASLLPTIPLGRWGDPDEIAKAVVFLASDDSSFITGIELFVDGGRAQV